MKFSKHQSVFLTGTGGPCAAAPAWRKQHVQEKDEEEEEGGDEGATTKEGEVKVEAAGREANGKMNEEDREDGPGDRMAGKAPPLSGTAPPLSGTFCLLRPLEEKLDAWLGESLDPFTGGGQNHP